MNLQNLNFDSYNPLKKLHCPLTVMKEEAGKNGKQNE